MIVEFAATNPFGDQMHSAQRFDHLKQSVYMEPEEEWERDDRSESVKAVVLKVIDNNEYK